MAREKPKGVGGIKRAGEKILAKVRQQTDGLIKSIDDITPDTLLFGHSFQVTLGKGMAGAKASFSEISGIEVSTKTEPKKTADVDSDVPLVSGLTYSDLVLKRGITKEENPISRWLQMHFDELGGVRVVPMDITIDLLHHGQIVKTWLFVKAFPIKLSMGALNSTNGEVLIETATLKYDRFTKML